MTILAPLARDDLIAPHIHNVLLERLWRRPLDIFPVQVKVAVVAGAPDLADIRTVLHDTREVGANGAECLKFIVGRPDQNRRLAAETENLPAVRFYFLRFNRNRHCVRRRFFDFGRDEIPAQRIGHGNEEGTGGGTQKPV